ncbi:MAG: amidophosphoribosyltransferase [Euryarchaeota archaeon]|jgi:amidophosphoribosyltransferase|nr:amidophosphoribosyltransferase [Euryarchaeota archaeon]
MCGIIGIAGLPESQVNKMLYDGLLVLQHRGQDAAGIVTCDEDHLHLRKSNGLVRDVFHERHLKRLSGSMGIGHVRYPTAGSCSSAEAQPLYVNSPYGITIAHNGNLVNAEEQARQLYLDDLRHVNTSSDSEVLLNVFAHELQKLGKENLKIGSDLYLDVQQIFKAVSEVHNRVSGGYAVVGMVNGYGLFAFRDPYGIRPLVYGVIEYEDGRKEWAVASESVALDTLGFEVVGDVAPGECIFITMNGEMYTQQCHSSPKLQSCIFEYVYFARPDSVIDGMSVHQARLNMGERLADKIMEMKPEHGIDVVMPIPDSGRYAAIQTAARLGVEFREGFVKNRYVGRTFIMPGQAQRQDSVRKKLNPLPSEFEGKTVLLVDDSIVRGNTSKKIVEMARQVGAKKVYFASSAPPLLHPNVYGIDMPARNEYIAHGQSIDEIGEAIGADFLVYQDLDELIAACTPDDGKEHLFDVSCFTGEYCTGDVSEDYLINLERARNDAAKSGNGESNDDDDDDDSGENDSIDMHNED